MSDPAQPSSREWSIADRLDRLESIAETLEEGEIGLERARELREEADDHLEVLEAELDVGDGEIIEVGDDHADPIDERD